MYGQQMNMFQEGGVMLEDEGGEVEEASGNEVPLGGTKEGVADDQPANLSPGEMVLSADVVNYHGVEKVMSWRDQAKIGYHKMEAMGQLGNADEATIPTEAIFNPGGMPFSVVDLEYIDMDDDADVAEAASGMYVQDEMNMQTGGTVPSVMSTNPVTGQPQIKQWRPPPPGTSPNITTLPVSMTPIPSTPTSASRTPGVITPSSPITQQPTVSTPPALPTIGEFLGGAQSFNQYINVDGNVIKIPVVNGQQTYPTPEGYQKYDPKKPKPFDPSLEQKDEEVKPETTLTQEPVIPDVGGMGPGDAFSPDFGPATGREALDIDVGARAGIDVGVSGLGYNATGNRTPNIWDSLVNAPSLGLRGLGWLGQKATELTPEQIAANKKAYNTKIDTLLELDKQLNPLNMTPREKVELDKAIKEGKHSRDAVAWSDRTTTEGTTASSGGDFSAPDTSAAGPAGGLAQGDVDVEGFGVYGGGPFGGGTTSGGAADVAAAQAEGSGGGTDFGGSAVGGGHGGTGEAAPAHGPGIDFNEGGFVPKIKFKSNPKQRRKGLAARK